MGVETNPTTAKSVVLLNLNLFDVCRLSDFPVHEKLEKFMEDVKYGIYPLTAFNLSQPTPTKPRHRPFTHRVRYSQCFPLKFPLRGTNKHGGGR
jgi:hypothetical protein